MSDATLAYHSCRLQALYTLARIIESEAEGNRFFSPEGAEELAIEEFQNPKLKLVLADESINYCEKPSKIEV